MIAQSLGPFDAHFLTPAFFEGGRVTVDSTHYIESQSAGAQPQRIPTHETEFAKDSVFGYSTSYLPDYVEEKTHGKIAASDVLRLTLDAERQGTAEQLVALENNRCVAVDGARQSDLDRFASDVLQTAAQGKKFLFRSAAGLLTSLAALPPQPVAPEQMHQFSRGSKESGSKGAIVVGSHVKKTTQQLESLLQLPSVSGIEIDVAQLKSSSGQPLPVSERKEICDRILAQVHQVYDTGKTPVIFTSRQELTFSDKATRLAFGEAVSALLVSIDLGLPADLGFLISKGGITTNDVLSQGLALTSARLLGQVIPGVSVVTTSPEHHQFPNLPVVLFPGNVGDEAALALAYQRQHR